MSDSNEACCPPSREQFQGPTTGPEAEEELAGFARAVGHPIRVAILRILIERDECVCGELVDELPVAQSTVSQHLRTLKEAELIRGTVDGPRVCYCIEPAGVDRFRRLVDSVLTEGEEENR